MIAESVSSLVARTPTSSYNFAHCLPSPLNLAVSKRTECGHEAWILDHVCHQFCRVTANAEEFQSHTFNEALERWMCRQSNSMAESLQLQAESDKWLDIASRAYDLDDNVQPWC